MKLHRKHTHSSITLAACLLALFLSDSRVCATSPSSSSASPDRHSSSLHPSFHPPSLHSSPLPRNLPSATTATPASRHRAKPRTRAALSRRQINLPVPQLAPSIPSLQRTPPSPSIPSPTQPLPVPPSSPVKPAPPSSQTQQPIALILPQDQSNITQRSFPYTPNTGANNSLELTPNITSTQGLVEIRIGLLLPFSLPNNLTQQLTFSGASAVRLAVSEINANHLIPGAYVTLVLKDSFNGLDPDNSGAAQAIFSTVSLLQTDGGVAGVIGDVSSALSMQSALLTSRLSIPQCSYSAGSTQLSSKDDYSHFFRTIPTELRFGKVMMDFVANRGWKKVAVLYTGDSLGSQMMDKIDIEAAKRNITIGYRRAFWDQGASSDVGPALEGLVGSGERIVLLAAVSVPQTRLMIEAVNRKLVSKDYVWLTMNQVTEPLLGGNPSLKPMDLNGLFMFDNLLKLADYPPYETFLDKWAALDPTEYPYAGQRDIIANEPQAYSCMMTMAHAFADIVRGNWTALHMLAAGRLGSRLRPFDMNVNYTGPGGPMVFDENGDVVYGNYILYNFQKGEAVPIGTSYSGVFNLSAPPMYFDGSTETPADSAPLQVINPTYGSALGLVIISVAGMGILFSLMIMVVVVAHRNAKVIKASSPLFCCLELCGFILLYVSTILGVDIPTRSTCMARPLAMDIGFVLVVSNIVAKNFRVYRIFHNIYVAKRVIKDSHLLKIAGSFLFGNLIIMVVWYWKATPTLEQIIMPDFTAYWACSNASGSTTPFFIPIFVYNGILLLIATYLAYKNRNVAANYNECRQIAFVVYNILLSGCLAVPTIFLPRDQFLTKFILSSVVILFGTTFSLMFLFMPKLWELFTENERFQNLTNKGPVVDDDDDGSTDGFMYNGPGWMNSTAHLGSMGKGRLPDSRKASVGTLDDSKGDTTREMYVGFMVVKLQYRYLSFLSSWRMQRVVLYPPGRYFTCFEPGQPETGRTFTYLSVSIESQSPGAYILRVVGNGLCDFLLQVRDEERLLSWHDHFDGIKPPANKSFPHSARTGGGMMHNGDFSMVNLSLAAVPVQEGGSSPRLGDRGVAPNEYPNESDRTLSLPMTRLQTLGLKGSREKISVNVSNHRSHRSSFGSAHMDLSPSTLYHHEERHHPHQPTHTQESFSGATLAAMSDSRE